MQHQPAGVAVTATFPRFLMERVQVRDTQEQDEDCKNKEETEMGKQGLYLCWVQ